MTDKIDPKAYAEACGCGGLQQRAQVDWKTQRAAYGSPSYPTE